MNLDHKDPPETMEAWDPQVHPEDRETRESSEARDRLDPLDRREREELTVTPALWDHPDKPVNQVQLVHQDLLELL